jgi:hypothetical protein
MDQFYGEKGKTQERERTSISPPLLVEPKAEELKRVYFCLMETEIHFVLNMICVEMANL